MADDKKVSYEIKGNVLAQVYTGLLRRVAAGYRCAVRTYTGKIKVYSSPFVLRMPYTEAKFICIHTLERTITYSDSIKTVDDITVTCGSPIVYHLRVGDNAKSISKIFNEIQADDRIKEIIKEIIDLIVKNSETSSIKNGFGVSPNNIPKWLSYDVKQEIIRRFNIIRDKYGVIIENVLNVDFNEPQEILQAETEAKAQKIKNNTAKEKALTEFEIDRQRAENDVFVGELRAKIDYIKKAYDYKSLYEAACTFNLSTSEIHELLKRQFTQTNTTIIETKGGFDALAAAILKGLKEYSLANKNSVNSNSDVVSGEKDLPSTVSNDSYNEGDFDSDIVDVNYTDIDDNSKSL